MLERKDLFLLLLQWDSSQPILDQSSDLMYITTLLALLALTTATLRITGHPDLVEYFANKYPGGLVPYSLANYGDVPYGKTLSGEIGLPSVLEDCVFEELPETSASKTILLVERNDCTFTQKSINVQKEGGKLAIIMDNISEDPDHIIMVDDGRGSQVHIPTLLINFEDGQEILNSLHSGPVVVSISFETVVREKAELTLWLDITDHKNFIFLRNLRPYFNKIKEHVDFTIAYPTKYCPSCLETDCFFSNAYCRNDFRYYGVENKGQLLIMEQLRQYFLFQTSVDKWWDYVLSYDELCDDLAVSQECSEGILKRLGMGIRIAKKVKASFETEDNPTLNQLAQMKYQSSIMYYPSVVVNSIVYRGNTEPFEINELICESLSHQPEGCSGYVTPASSSTLSTWIIFVIVLTVAFGIFLVLCYRRVARRQLASKINSQVNQLVNQYITMYETDRYTQATELPNRPARPSPA